MELLNKKIAFVVFFDNKIENIIEYIKIELKEAFKKEIKMTTENEINFELVTNFHKITEYKSYVFLNRKNNIVYLDSTGEAYHSLIYCISTRKYVESIYIKLADEVKYPCYFFDYFTKDGKERTIYSMKDGNRWKFYSKGPVQDFEDENLYKNILIKSKFNKKILIDYCNKLGVDIEDKEFWEPQGEIYHFIR
ncbi:MAG: hypothetical protein JW881_13640 [Spirochaetales bacterium]|nr:hypothetical protein [Spirochaetales bacterium]